MRTSGPGSRSGRRDPGPPAALGEEEAPDRPSGRWPHGSFGTQAAAVLRGAGGALTLDALAEALPAVKRPGGDWRARLRQSLARTPQVCLVGTSTYDLAERRLSGARLRHVLTQAEARHGLLLAEPELADLLLWWETFLRDGTALPILDADGASLEARLAFVTGPDLEPARGWGYRLYRVVTGLGEWMARAGARPGDDVCFQALPPDGRRFRVSVEPAAPGPRGDLAVARADASLAEAALAILARARALTLPGDLLRRLAGQMDLRVGPGPHLPVFTLGRDPRFAFDGSSYGPFALAVERNRRRITTSHPRPEDYPSDWPARDPVWELRRLAEGPARLTLWYTLAGPIQVGGTPHPARLASVLARMVQSRAMLWDLLQDRSRLLNVPAARRRAGRQRYGNVIQGPWPGAGGEG